MKIKICGLTDPLEAAYLNKEQVNFAGMVLFFPKSRRSITIDRAREIMEVLDDSIRSVAVTVAPTLEQVLEIQEAGFDYIQIHGELSAELAEQIRIPILKAFNVSDIEQYDFYESLPQIAGYVFDAAEPGSGRAFDWSMLKEIPRSGRLFLLAGGLRAENVAEAIDMIQPDGVDVSSGVEYTDHPGKDPERISEFVRQVRKAEHTALARKIAGESFVLLKNEGNVLPLQRGRAAFFGEGAYRLVIGGSGSGSSRKTEKILSIAEACAAQGIENVEALQAYYEEELAGHVHLDPIEEFFAKGGDAAHLVASGAIYELFGQYSGKEAEILPSAELLAQAAAETDTAVAVISRATGGEECDRHLKDDYLLLDSERELLGKLNAAFAHLVVVLNVNGQIDLSWVDSYKNIQAVLFIGAPGEQGGNAAADVLSGKVTPSGKLAFTIAEAYEDCPTADTFSFDKDHPDQIREYKDYGLDAEANGSIGFVKSPVTLYREGLYMGYRYYDSFGKDVLYPFGYGLSYADFRISDIYVMTEHTASESGECEQKTTDEPCVQKTEHEVSEQNVQAGQKNRNCPHGCFTVAAAVTNLSAQYSGREVVQIYVSQPQTDLEKPYQVYAGSTKTELVCPSDSTQITCTISYRDIASYDEEKSAWMLEAGYYYIRVGNSSRNTRIAGCLYVPETILCEQAHRALSLSDANAGKIELLSAKDAAPITYVGEEKEMAEARIHALIVQKSDIPETGGKNGKDAVVLSTRKSNTENKCRSADDRSTQVYPEAKTPAEVTFADVYADESTAEALIRQFSVEELAVLLNGYGPGLPFGTAGIENPPTIYYADGSPIGTNTHKTGGYGYVSAALEKYGIKSVYYKDGPASVGETAWPTGMLLACSFDPKLQYAFGAACGYEACRRQVDSWLAPGMNLQRNPLGGRNFEYFSEDPIVAGSCGVQVCLGAMQQNPITACPKHFALNEQETYRRGSRRLSYDAVDSIVTERTARELYLRPFEMVICRTPVRTLMTSFNKINGIFAAGNADLCTKILREEWGYTGVVVTDWGDMDQVVDGADAVAAGNDVVMPGGPPVIAQMLKGYEEGRVSIEQLREAARHMICGMLKQAGE